MKTYFASYLIITASIFSTFPDFASAASNGKASKDLITKISVAGDNATIDLATGDETDRQSCVTNNRRFAFKNNTGEGEAFLRVALAAKLSGKPVTVYGNGTCNGSGEALLQIELH